MRKNIYLLTFFLFCCFLAKAQEKHEKVKKERKNAFAISAGISGVGFEYARVLNQHFSLRVVYNSLNLENIEIQDFELDNQNTDIILNVKNLNYDFLIEYLPFKSSSLKLILGAAYFTDLSISGNLTFDSEQKVGDITLTKDDFGDLNIGVDWPGSFAPYLGIGFGRAIPKKRLGIAIEVGGYYLGSPLVNLSATRLLTPTEEANKETLQEGFDSVSIVPNFKLKLAYSF